MSRPAAGGPSLTAGAPDGQLVLVRHGQSTFVAEGRFQGRLDPPLTPLGERQAALAGACLARPGSLPGIQLDPPPLRIVHSPLSRAARSAELIAAAQQAASGIPAGKLLTPDDAFAEVAQGEWEGHTMAEVTARWGDLLAAWRRSPTTAWAPGGESLGEAHRRVRVGLTRLLAALAEGHRGSALPLPWAIIVAHDGILRLVLLALLDLPIERFWAVPFVLGGITVVELRGGRAHLRTHNSAAHLAELEAGGGATRVAGSDAGGAIAGPPRDGAL